MSRIRSNQPSSVVELEVVARRDQRPLPAPLPHTADRGGCLAPARLPRRFVPPDSWIRWGPHPHKSGDRHHEDSESVPLLVW